MYIKYNISHYMDKILYSVLFAVFFNYIYLTLTYANQPPIDEHSFRQSQTAISIYWMIKDGFSFAYETPILGKPWAIPFEFPVYQTIVSFLHFISGIDINILGRVVSSFFLIACLFPIYFTSKLHNIQSRFILVFSVLLFTNPIYLYWGRTILIETTALFLSLCAAYFFEAAYKRRCSFINIAFLFLFASAAFLQKITTSLPVFAVLAAIASYREIKYVASHRSILVIRSSMIFLFGFLLPAFIGYKWIIYTDDVKSKNTIGSLLTSYNLRGWNWGTTSQKTDISIYKLTLIDRFTLSQWCTCLIISLVVIYFSVVCRDRKKVLFYLICASLYVAPVVIFTNLHFVHNYYQTANAIYFIIFLALMIEHLLSIKKFEWLGISAVIAVAGFNVNAFYETYYGSMVQNHRVNSREYIVGETVRWNTSQDDQFIGLGSDWSSTIPYIAERKAFMVADWYKDRALVLSHPEQFLDDGKFSLMLSCAPQGISEVELMSFARERAWSMGRVKDCNVAFKTLRFSPEAVKTVQCEGRLSEVSEETIDRQRVLSLKGLIPRSDSVHSQVGSVYIQTVDGDRTQYFQALRVPSEIIGLDANVDTENAIGFSSLIPLTDDQADIRIHIAERRGNQLEVCDSAETVLR